MHDPQRRRFLAAGLVAGTALAFPGVACAAAPATRRLRLHNTHTGESLDVTYCEAGVYVPEALAQLDRLLRDHRANVVAPMGRGVLDLVHDLTRALDTQGPVEIISGYRSPQTNAQLRRTGGGGVARHSLHMDGIAMDIRIPGRDLQTVRAAALALGRGGVGFYPRENFVHVDTGRVRQWG